MQIPCLTSHRGARRGLVEVTKAFSRPDSGALCNPGVLLASRTVGVTSEGVIYIIIYIYLSWAQGFSGVVRF